MNYTNIMKMLKDVKEKVLYTKKKTVYILVKNCVSKQ